MEGTHFLLVTDHNALLWLFRQPNLRGKLARWALDLQQLSFDIVHRAGKAHFVPDAVSRLRRLDENDSNDEQGLETDEVSDKAFEVANFNVNASSVVSIAGLFNSASTFSNLELTTQPDYNVLFASEQCSALKLVSVAVAQQRDFAVFSVEGLEFLKTPLGFSLGSSLGSPLGSGVLNDKSTFRRAHPRVPWTGLTLQLRLPGFFTGRQLEERFPTGCSVFENE